MIYRHLLGKKSWNVYNAENIAKVKRDEAAAEAREAAEEQRMQEVDSERRIQQLRGLSVEPPSTPTPSQLPEAQSTKHGEPRRERKRKRISGEDDTQRDIRYALEDTQALAGRADLQLKSLKTTDAPLTDRKGNISLFPVDESRHHAPKNKEAEAEKAKKKKEYEDQYTMRFSNAAGFKQSIGQTPWYQSLGAPGQEMTEDSIPSKDVWGNEDPRRKDREKRRMVTEDPMAIIQRGVQDLRKVERERKTWEVERQRELMEMAREERKRRRRKRSEDRELEEFSLDASADTKDGSRHSQSRATLSRHSHRRDTPRRTQHHSHGHRHRSRSKEDSNRRHRVVKV